jgi:mRNA interferase MazF
MFRNDLYWVDLTPYSKANSSIQSGVRPVWIGSNNSACKHSPVIFVSPVTSRFSKPHLPCHVQLGEESGLDKPSILMLEQIITIDKKDLGDYIGTVPNHKVYEIDRALIISGGIDIEQQKVNIIDKNKIDNLIGLINDTNEMLEVVNNNYFYSVRDTLISELKNYCEQCGANFEVLIKNRIKDFTLKNIGDVISV